MIVDDGAIIVGEQTEARASTIIDYHGPFDVSFNKTI